MNIIYLIIIIVIGVILALIVRKAIHRLESQYEEDVLGKNTPGLLELEFRKDSRVPSYFNYERERIYRAAPYYYGRLSKEEMDEEIKRAVSGLSNYGER